MYFVAYRIDCDICNVSKASQWWRWEEHTSWVQCSLRERPWNAALQDEMIWQAIVDASQVFKHPFSLLHQARQAPMSCFILTYQTLKRWAACYLKSLAINGGTSHFLWQCHMSGCGNLGRHAEGGPFVFASIPFHMLQSRRSAQRTPFRDMAIHHRQARRKRLHEARPLLRLGPEPPELPCPDPCRHAGPSLLYSPWCCKF